jgi:hypothetical protein
VNADFNWWLLIVGLVLGAALTWLVMAESTRRDTDLDEEEQRGEALWISSLLSTSDQPTEPRQVEEVLRLHREYLAAPPPDEVEEPAEEAAEGPSGERERPVAVDERAIAYPTEPAAAVPPEDR